jgi:hypothetical protein
VAGFCEHGHEPSCSKKCGEFLHRLIDCHLFKYAYNVELISFSQIQLYKYYNEMKRTSYFRRISLSIQHHIENVSNKSFRSQVGVALLYTCIGGTPFRSRPAYLLPLLKLLWFSSDCPGE